MKTLSALALLLASNMAWSNPGFAHEAFATPDAAVEAFVAALKHEPPDEARFAQLLGEDWRTYIPRGGVQQRDVQTFLAEYHAQHSLDSTGPHSAQLVVGREHWALPIPLLEGANGWHFDLKAGSAEIRARRIGRNELAAMQSMLAYHDAQTEYASQDRNGNGALEYARRIFSSPGKHDGLYWADQRDGQVSPLGPLFGDDKAGDDWYGYHFRILEAQGPSAPGGAYDYLIGGHMTRGFALVAWPARYDDSGVMSFMVSHDGQVFEKDLGPDGARQAMAMKRFDPDSSWAAVTVPGE
ncbi:DUF2950 domain-containing protein [Pseudomonas fakonensis]|uniref:DUF2950 domain-containing protein n=1 Tax=Pseudomonas fakonensis TaxID=2842355 RepID=A0ABX8N2D4_9PSED|nr:DUF2950 domain-containing protein [Pseudomonas fakonensis]QXH49602.1 DUF2950 domain-containing protein [Pseudomonas fakonensis]